MSRVDSPGLDDLPPAVCEWCGEQIDDDGQECPARSDRWCSP